MRDHRILIVGFGSIGKRHLRVIRRNNPNADIRILRREETSAPPLFSNGVFTEYEEVRAFCPTLAVIANPSAFHVPVAMLLAQAGCHLLIEKPISSKTKGVRQLLELSQKQGIVLQVGYNMRFSKSLALFRHLIRSGTIGRVLSVRCEVGQYLPNWRPGTDYRLGVSARSDLGGGVLRELSHEIDYLRWIFGDVLWVNAYIGRSSQLEVQVEDVAHLIMGQAGESDARGLVTSLSMDFFRRDTTRNCVAIGEEGSIRWKASAGSVEHLKAEGVEWDTIFLDAATPDEVYAAQWAEFLECVEHNRTPLVSGWDGLAALAVIEAAEKSSGLDGLRVAVAR